MLNFNDDAIFSGFEISQRGNGEYEPVDYYRFFRLKDIFSYLKSQRGFISAEIIWHKDMPEELYPHELRDDEILPDSMDILILIRRKGFQPGVVHHTFLKLAEAKTDRDTGLPTTDRKRWIRPCDKKPCVTYTFDATK